MNAYCGETEPCFGENLSFQSIFSEPDTYHCDALVDLPVGFSCGLTTGPSTYSTLPKPAEEFEMVKLSPMFGTLPLTPVNPSFHWNRMNKFGSQLKRSDAVLGTENTQPELEALDTKKRKCDDTMPGPGAPECYSCPSPGIDTFNLSKCLMPEPEVSRGQENYYTGELKYPAVEIDQAFFKSAPDMQRFPSPPMSDGPVLRTEHRCPPLQNIRLDLANGSSCNVSYPTNNAKLAELSGIDMTGPALPTPLQKHRAKVKKLTRLMRENRAREEEERRLREEERHRRALRRAALKGEEPPEDLPQWSAESPESPSEEEFAIEQIPGTGSAAEALRFTGISTLDYDRLALDPEPHGRVTIVGLKNDNSVGGIFVDVPEAVFKARSSHIDRRIEDQSAGSETVITASHRPLGNRQSAVGLLTQMVQDPKLWKVCMQEIRGGVRCRNKQCMQPFSCIAELARHYDSESRSCGASPMWYCSVPTCPWSLLGFSKQGEIHRHSKSLHSSEGYRCPSCGRVYSRPDSLKRHLLKCTEKLPLDIQQLTHEKHISPTAYLMHAETAGQGPQCVVSSISHDDSLEIRRTRMSRLVLAVANIKHDFLSQAG